MTVKTVVTLKMVLTVPTAISHFLTEMYDSTTQMNLCYRLRKKRSYRARLIEGLKLVGAVKLK